MALAPLSTRFQSLPPLPTIKLVPSGADSQVGGWACAWSRPLGVSPTTFPVRLGVSPAASPTPMSVFNQRFEALSPSVGALVPAVCPGLSMHECGATGSATCRSACPILRHSKSGPLGLSVCECGAAGSASGHTACPVCPTLHQSQSRQGPTTAMRVLSTLVPVSAPPTGLDGCLFSIYLVSDFLAVRFSVSSDCARRRCVSTYTAILVLPIHLYITQLLYL